MWQKGWKTVRKQEKQDFLKMNNSHRQNLLAVLKPISVTSQYSIQFTKQLPQGALYSKVKSLQ